MFLRGRGADPESRTDLLVRRTRSDERDDLALTRGEPIGPHSLTGSRRRLTLAQPPAKDLTAERGLSAERAQQRAAQALRRTVHIDVSERSRPEGVARVRGARVLGHDDRRPRAAELSNLFPREAIVSDIEDDVQIRKLFFVRHSRRAPERDWKLKVAEQTEDRPTPIDHHEAGGSGFVLKGLFDV